MSSASPVSAGGLRSGPPVDPVTPVEEDPLPADRPTADDQDFAALLLGDYRPGRDWHPDPLPATPPPDTVIGYVIADVSAPWTRSELPLGDTSPNIGGPIGKLAL